MRKIILSIGLQMILPFGWAQSYLDVVKIYYSTSQQNNFKNSHSNTTVNEIGLDVTLPIRINIKTTLLTGFGYETIETRIVEDYPHKRITAASIRIGLNAKYSDSWSVTYLAIPKIASDFQSSQGKGFQLGGLVALKYSIKNDLNFKAALYYNSECFGPFVVPILGMYHLSKNKKWEVNLMLPQLADVNYRVYPRLAVGANFSGQLKSFLITNFSGDEEYLVKAANDLGAYLKYNITKASSLQIRMGHSIGRSYRLYEKSDKINLGISFLKFGDERNQLNTDFENGLVFQAMVAYRFVQATNGN
jgi:hypothetical protein